jgi:endonuclease/exonuclease/phosphatase family metal-dependent hydrolase
MWTRSRVASRIDRAARGSDEEGAHMGNLRLQWMVVASLLVACNGGQGDVAAQNASAAGQTAAAGATNPGRAVGQNAIVMTRNLFLGADLAPAIAAPNLPAFVAGTGLVVRQVTATNFPIRAKGLAAEILAAQPDLVGLQEVALWRTGPASIAPLLGAPKTASTVRYDFLQLLLDQLNAGGELYRPVVVEEEFDFEAPADENGISGDGPVPIVDAELNVRLTMRDVILARVSGSVHVSEPQSGHFQTLLALPVLGSPVPVTRGWTAIDARVRGGVAFRFVNTHLESFDPRALHPSIRALQAAELAAPGGPASGDLPVVLVGDLNSDDDTVAPDDQQAYRALLAAGFVERSTGDPLGCCIESSFDLTTGTAAEFDHQVDHVMTNAPSIVRLVSSSVTGRTMVNGFWDSDHAGLVSELHIR